MKNILGKIGKILKTKKFLAILLLFLFLMPSVINAQSNENSGLFGHSDADFGTRADYPSGIFGDALYWVGMLGKTANNPLGFLSSVVIKGAATIAYAIAHAMGQIIQLFSKLLAWVVDISQFTRLGVVQQGWKICRDFSNLFFIAILIYIAFAIILRLQNANPKKMLFKVVFMAIAINFSLMIGGIVIDFSQMMFKYFIFAPLQVKDGAHFSENLANSLKLQTFWASNTQEGNTKEAMADKTDIFQVLIKLLFIIVFSCLMLVTFGALVFILLIRNFWLWILLILAPLAWFLGMVPIPMLLKYSSEWWRNFIKWCFMAPIMGFFIFLATSLLLSGNSSIVSKNGLIDKEKLKEQTGGDTAIFKYTPGNSSNIFDPTNVMQMLVVLGFLIGGLMAGQSLGSGVAGGALGLVKKAGANTQKWMGRKAMQTAPVRGVGNALMAMGNIPIVGGVFKRAGMATQGGAARAKGEDLKKAQDRTKYMSDDQLNKNWDTFNKFEKQAATKKIGYDKLSKEQFKEMQDIYSKQGMNKELKDMEKAAPHFTSDFKREADKLAEESKRFSEKDEGYKKRSDTLDDEIQRGEKINGHFEKADKEAGVNFEQAKKSGNTENIIKTKEIKTAAGINSQKSSDALSELRKKKEELTKNREKDQIELDRAGLSVLERLKDTDLSKITGLSKLLGDKEQRETPYAQAVLYAVEHKSAAENVKFISNLEAKRVDGKKDVDGTMNLRKEIGNKIMEDLYSDGGIDAVLKMTKINSSPSAMAGGYGFNALVDGMKMIDTGIKADIKQRAYKQKKTDEFISKIAEEVSERNIKGTEKERREEKNTEAKEAGDIKETKGEKP